MRLLYLPVNSVFVLLVYFDISLNIQALLVCPAMSGPASLSVIVLSCNFSQPDTASTDEEPVPSAAVGSV